MTRQPTQQSWNKQEKYADRVELALRMKRSAILSDDGMYRYQLTREWDATKDTVAFIMVNPSTADAAQDDATIRKCIGFARRWGYGRLLVANLFAYRATDIKQLWLAPDPVGLRCTPFLEETMWAADQVVVAWGPTTKLPSGVLRDRWRIVPRLAAKLGTRHNPLPLACLGMAKDGHPVHPLMIPYKRDRQWWKPPAA